MVQVIVPAEQHRMGRPQHRVVENLPKDQGHRTVCPTKGAKVMTLRPLPQQATGRMLMQQQW
jgi:hypothetical protein